MPGEQRDPSPKQEGGTAGFSACEHGPLRLVMMTSDAHAVAGSNACKRGCPVQQVQCMT
jgi:hypothetical protein